MWMVQKLTTKVAAFNPISPTKNKIKGKKIKLTREKPPKTILPLRLTPPKKACLLVRCIHFFLYSFSFYI